MEIIRKALSTPCATIAKNAGVDPSIVVQKVVTSPSANEGYDALHDCYVDMIEEGESGFVISVTLSKPFFRKIRILLQLKTLPLTRPGCI